MNKTVKFFVDPLCAWCWGQKPTIERIMQDLDDKVTIEFYMGGMRVRNNTKKIEGDYKQYLIQIFDRVSKLSGQTMRKKVLDTKDLYFDSEYPCRAVMLIRKLKDDIEAIKYLHKIQSAYFIDSINITKPELLAELAGDGFVEDTNAFLLELMSPENERASFEEYNYVKQQGVRGFPEIQFIYGNRIMENISGFADYSKAKSIVQKFLTL